ncbi:DUF1080 domain-containing protein [Allomuricauda sp. SCSIO 65647]|uniref:3-keto-disaccharide hydrolase n=1 Tax=Allomuricauda sp. SCSIO 65647 TaxID=2908843 RepID=UPI001F2AF9ED|nr:DUF1080 domain-containing protein [Muricauda sp. SCSIO 65647]UJH68867.1 DUF1080 domain-containing protein [Muricauda sp. SCSIO 65647]
MTRYALILLILFSLSCKQKEKEEPKTEEEMTEMAQNTSQEQWQILFDGTSFDRWHLYGGGEIGEQWKLEDGAMVFYPPKERPEGASYNIVTDDEYTNFVLSLEWKVSEGGNSGIFWGVHEDEKFGQPYQTGPEIQVLDDERHPDAKNGTTHQAGALYDMVAPSKNVVKPAGEWNKVVLTINHNTNQGSVVMNGETIVEFPVHGEEWDKMVANSKFADWEGFGSYKTGKIGLQDHHDVVAYRNIKIKQL